MDNNEWDDNLKDKLEDYKPEGLQPDWESFSNYLFVHEQMSEWEEDEAFDENLKETVSGFEALPIAEGWERIENSLNLADQQFDEHVRNKIEHYEPPYNPRTWPLLMQRVSGVAYLRAKLIAFKVVEVAAVMLLLFTVVKMGQMGKLPFETPLFESPRATTEQPLTNTAIADNTSSNTNTHHQPEDGKNNNDNKTPIKTGDATVTAEQSLMPENPASDPSIAKNDLIENVLLENGNRSRIEKLNSKTPHPISFTSINSIQTESDIIAIEQHVIGSGEDKENEIDGSGNGGDENVKRSRSFGAAFLATILSPIRSVKQIGLPKPYYVKQRSRTYTEFGIVSQLDYNEMRIPEDKLYIAGRQKIFPQKGLPGTSVGGGFSFALGHPRWAVETGLIYTGKNFKPGRHFFVGDSLNRSNLEFEAMSLQLFSIPFQYRYRFDNKGAFKFYGLAGFGLNLIAQSNIDVVIKYDFQSLAPGENPDNNPYFAQTISETRRIREHIRDGAPFSTKSFLSVNAGAGIEYSISENKTLFLQSAVQYQVPNLKFSNNNGKHIRSLSIQAGVRTPLGK